MIRAWIVVDLGCGDQGKGSITDFLVRDQGARLVIRANGGAQAGHRVVTPDGRVHVFSQFGAGTFVSGVRTWLTSGMAVQPSALLVEAAHLARKGVSDALSRLTISAEAPVITPYHRILNRLREQARGENRHGSCGIGYGETVLDARRNPHALKVKDLFSGDAPERLLAVGARLEAEARTLAERLGELSEDLSIFGDGDFCRFWLENLAPLKAVAVCPQMELSDALFGAKTVVFEGAQGVLLDELAGFTPHTSVGRCTDHQARALLQYPPAEISAIGVLRCYATRHGAGPLPTEDSRLFLPDPSNQLHPFQGPFRVGHFDAVTARHALSHCQQIDGIALTCLDRLPVIQAAGAYTLDGQTLSTLGGPGADWTERLSRALPVLEPAREARQQVEALLGPVWLSSEGPAATEKRWHH